MIEGMVCASSGNNPPQRLSQAMRTFFIFFAAATVIGSGFGFTATPLLRALLIASSSHAPPPTAREASTSSAHNPQPYQVLMGTGSASPPSIRLWCPANLLLARWFAALTQVLTLLQLAPPEVQHTIVRVR